MVRPKHYSQYATQPISICQDVDFILGNIIKYLSRYKSKNGKEDLLKALTYCDFYINKNYVFNNLSNSFLDELDSSNDIKECLSDLLNTCDKVVKLKECINKELQTYQ